MCILEMRFIGKTSYFPDFLFFGDDGLDMILVAYMIGERRSPITSKSLLLP